MVAYLSYTLRMKMLFHGWPIMVHDTHTRRRLTVLFVNVLLNYFLPFLSSPLPYSSSVTLLLHDVKQHGTFHSARWQRDYSSDLCWISTTVGCPHPASCVVLGDFPHSQHRPSVTHIGLQLPIIRGVQCRRWNFRKADWASYTLAIERSIPLIPVNNISVEESYQGFCGAMQKATRHSIPRGFRPTYTLCSDEECQDLLQQYEESGDSDIAGHLTESLDVARRHR